MPVSVIGQEITFASQRDPDQHYTNYVYVRALKGDTIAKIAARKGEPEMVKEILKLNRKLKLKNKHYLRSARQPLPTHALVRLPGTLAQADSFSVTCGNQRPKITKGYATYDVVDRPGRVGLSRFKGYDPVEMAIQVQFEGWRSDSGKQIEANIAKLERMAGRGHFRGAASGPPAVIRVSVTTNDGKVIPLIPPNYQWSPQNPTAPLYRISDISWDDNALGDDAGNRTRQGATITVTQYTPLNVIKRSSSQRAKAQWRKSTKNGDKRAPVSVNQR